MPTNELDDAKLAIFVAVTGCSCFLCHCEDWKKIKITKKDYRKGRDGRFRVSKKVLTRIKKELFPNVVV